MQVIGTAGHVDHGKSTLVLKLTGIDPDRFAEEKRRGLTIDLGFAWLPLPSGREIGLIDVPGHERFIKNMLAGAGGISMCLFVVAANEGWMPQSAEHLSALHVLGITSGVVAVTKSDTVDSETLDYAVAEVHEHLAPTSLRDAAVVPVSAVTGSGLDELVAAIDAAVGTADPAPDHGRPRLWVDRAFSISGAGTVITGTLAGGSLAAGDEIEIAPRSRRARIRTIQSHKKEVSAIGPGNRVALNLAGLDRRGAERGDAVVRHGQWRPSARVDVLVEVLPAAIAGHEHELTEKGAHLLYVGSAETPVKVTLLGTTKVGPDESAFAQLNLRDPLPLGRGDRFVLRDAGRVLTIGGGRILDPLPARARRRDTTRLELLRKLTEDDGALRALVEDTGMIEESEAVFRSGSSLVPDDVVKLDRWLVSGPRFGEIRDAVAKILAEHHAAHPLERGMARESLRAQLSLEPDAFEALLPSLSDVVEEGPIVRLGGHSVAYDESQQRARDELIATIEDTGFNPPLAKELRADAALLRSLVDSGELVKVGDFFLTRARAEEARAAVKKLIEDEGPATVAEIRDALGTSRKYAVPLCEWLDSSGVTLRKGDTRVLRT